MSMLYTHMHTHTHTLHFMQEYCPSLLQDMPGGCGLQLKILLRIIIICLHLHFKLSASTFWQLA